MKKMDSVCLDVIDIYKKLTMTDAFVNVYSPTSESEFGDSTINDLIERYKAKPTKKVYPVSYEKIQYGGIIPYHISPHIGADPGNKKTFKKFISMNKTGLFKINFSDNNILLVAKWIEGFGRNEMIRTLVFGEGYTYYSYLKAFEFQKKNIQKPSNGVFRVVMSQFGPIYTPIKDLPTSPVIHPKVEEIENDIKYYFDNVQLFSRFKQSGVRKFMLVSEPGTGKSSIFYKISKIYSKTKSIVFCTDIASAAAHLSTCSKYKVSTIVFIEDADSTFGASAGNSGVLNFLDGVDTPHNPEGSLIMMSTNFPERIEPRILTRPGRIDKIFNINNLNGEWAIKCAELYFSEYFDVTKNKKEIYPVVNEMTGAQIKELALASMSYAASSQKPIDIQLVKEVKGIFSKNLSEAYKYAEQNSLKKLSASSKKNFGFVEDEELESF